MAHQTGHRRLGNSSGGPSTPVQPIRSLADLVLDPKNFSSVLANASNPAPSTLGPQTDTPSPTAAHNNPPSSSGEEHSRTSIADLVLNNVTYDAIIASSTRGLELEPETHISLAEHVMTPPNSPAPGSKEYGSLLGVSAAIMKADGK